MFLLAAFVLAEAALLTAIVLLREPKLLIPAVILGLPFEVLETELLGTLGEGGLGGALRSLLNPGQAAMVATVGIVAIRARHRPLLAVPPSRVLVPIALLALVFALGVTWSDSLLPGSSVLVLPLYFAFLVAAPSLVENRRDLERILGAFLVAAIALSLLAVAQRGAGVFQWRGILIQSDAFSYRSNATFADPNILGRFLALAGGLAAGLVLATGPRRITVHLAVPVLVVAPPALVATASRSGWLAFLLCGFLVVLFAPIPRYRKALLTVAAGVLVAVLVAMVLAQGGASADRIRSISAAWSIVGQRSFLIHAGWEMFKANPLAGVGSGSFQSAITITYLDLVPYWARATTLSHTAFVSILAELGLIGIFALGFSSVRVALVAVRTYFAQVSPQHRLVTGWIGAGLITVVLHSQSEGRFLEEPYLWVLLALLVAVETRGEALLAQPTVPPAPAPVLAPAIPDPPAARPAAGPLLPAGGSR